MLPFVDISENNGNYDMGANTDSLIAIRVSTGVLTRADNHADVNYKNAYDAGKRIIQYHYCGTNDPTAEANLFLEVCKPFNQYDMFCIDAELGQSKAWKQTFADVVKAATGCNVIDYMNISLANALGALPDCALWLAAPSWPFNEPVTEFHNGEYLFQQGPAVNGVDTDVAYTTIDVIDKYGYQVPVPQPAPVPAPVVPEPTITVSVTTTSTSSSSSTSTTTTTLPVIVRPTAPAKSTVNLVSRLLVAIMRFVKQVIGVK